MLKPNWYSRRSLSIDPNTSRDLSGTQPGNIWAGPSVKCTNEERTGRKICWMSASLSCTRKLHHKRRENTTFQDSFLSKQHHIEGRGQRERERERERETLSLFLSVSRVKPSRLRTGESRGLIPSLKRLIFPSIFRSCISTSEQILDFPATTLHLAPSSASPRNAPLFELYTQRTLIWSCHILTIPASEGCFIIDQHIECCCSFAKNKGRRSTLTLHGGLSHFDGGKAQSDRT